MNKKYAIYTALIGNYDTIRQPLVVDGRFDYVLFTDDVTTDTIGIWKVKQVCYKNNDRTRIARYVKTHPHSLLPEYDATIWIDGNIQITSHYLYNRCILLCKNKIQIASVKHPYRDCIYEEAYSVYGLDLEKVIFEWCHFLRHNDYPKRNGLYETNVLFRMKDSDVENANEMWWTIIEKYSRRDQLSFNYVLWCKHLKEEYILPVNQSSANTPYLSIYQHRKTANQIGRRKVVVSFGEHARNRCRNGLKEKISDFKEFHYWLYKRSLLVGKLLLYIWGWYALIFYGATIKYRTYKRRKNEK